MSGAKSLASVLTDLNHRKTTLLDKLGVHQGALYENVSYVPATRSFQHDFSLSYNPLGPSKAVVDALRQKVLSVSQYPDYSYTKMRESIAAYNAVQPENVVIGDGICGLMKNFIHGVLSEGDEYISSACSFFFPEITAHISGAAVHRIPNAENFAVNYEGMLSAINPRTKMIYLCSPASASSMRLNLEELADFVNRACRKSRNLIIIIDEAYFEFEDQSIAGLITSCPQLIVLRTFSKAFALPGLRVGYALGDAHTIADISRLIPTMTVTSLAEVGVVASLNHVEDMLDSVDWIKKKRQSMATKLTQLGFQVLPSVTDYLVAKIPSQYRASDQLIASLNDKGINIASGCDIQGLTDQYVRICIRPNSMNKVLIMALREVVSLPQQQQAAPIQQTI